MSTSIKKYILVTWKILYYLQLFIFLILVIFSIYLFSATDHFVDNFARFIVIERNPAVSDVIVVTSGDENEKRIGEGIRLYQEGYGKIIILSGYGDHKNSLARTLLTEAGIDESRYFFEAKAESTFENANFLKDYMKEKDYNSMVVVTSPQQSRRGRLVFNAVFPDKEISISYTDDSFYDPDLLFENKAIRESFKSEAIKYMYYLFKYTFYRA